MRPSERAKKRYLLYKVIGPEKEQASESQAKEAIYKSVMKFFGELAYSELYFKIVEQRNGQGILRCRRGKEVELVSCLALMSEIAGKRARPMPLRTSGTLKSLREATG